MSQKNVELVRRSTDALGPGDFDGFLEDWASEAHQLVVGESDLERVLAGDRSQIRSLLARRAPRRRPPPHSESPGCPPGRLDGYSDCEPRGDADTL